MNNQMLVLLLQFVVIGAVFYFLIIRPQGQARQQQPNFPPVR